MKSMEGVIKSGASGDDIDTAHGSAAAAPPHIIFAVIQNKTQIAANTLGIALQTVGQRLSGFAVGLGRFVTQTPLAPAVEAHIESHGRIAGLMPEIERPTTPRGSQLQFLILSPIRGRLALFSPSLLRCRSQ